MTRDPTSHQPAKKLSSRANRSLLSVEPIAPANPIDELLKKLFPASMDDRAGPIIRF